MKIYFNASLRQSADYKLIYQRIVNHLKKNKHEVFEVVLSEHMPDIQEVTSKNIKEWHKEWNTYINQADFAIIEGSYPSTIHIGFEIGMILAHGKPVIFLYNDGKEPKFINEIFSPRLIRSGYTEFSVEDVLDWCMEEVKHHFNKRFTFFISPEIEDFLQKISNKNFSRAEFIRSLIEKEMRNQ